MGAIAILSFLAYFSLSLVIKEEENSSALINLSGLQRMLSQRVLLTSMELIEARDRDTATYDMQRSRLLQVVEHMEKNHATLVNVEGDSGTASALSPALNAIYFSAPHKVDERIRRFIAEAKSLAATPKNFLSQDNQAFVFIVNNAVELLASLDAVVASYELESRQTIARILVMERAIFGITIFVLLLEAMFIFRPMVRQLNKEAVELITSMTRFTGIATSLSEGLIVTDPEGIVQFVNPAAAKCLGWERMEMVHMRLNDIVSGANGELIEVASPIIQGDMPKYVEDGVFIQKDGTPIPVAHATNKLEESGKIVRYVITFRDISERKRHEQQIQHLAYHDSLTHLPNRRLFSDLLSLELAHARREEGSLAVLFLDLDGFKSINDQLGHDAGDEVLQEVARRIQAVVRESDTVARMGGDEFMLLLPRLERKDAAAIAKKIIKSIALPVSIGAGDRSASVSASIGISLFPVDGDSGADLIVKADSAMYCGKKHGKNCYKFYSELKCYKQCKHYTDGCVIPEDKGEACLKINSAKNLM